MCLDYDFYVLVDGAHRTSALKQFIDSYVGPDQRQHRLPAFLRTYLDDRPLPEDDALLVELRPDPEVEAFTIYLDARNHARAMVTITREGDMVLGLSRDAATVGAGSSYPTGGERQARKELLKLMNQFKAPHGMGGVELPPPLSTAAWWDEGLVMMRLGPLPPT